MLFQIASLFEQEGNFQEALKWFKEVVNIKGGPTDPGIYARMGQVKIQHPPSHLPYTH